MSSEPEPSQRFDLCASLEEMIENPEGEFALSCDLDDALDLLARVRNYCVVDDDRLPLTRMLGLEKDIDTLLARHRRHP